MYDLVFLAITVPLGFAAAAVGRTVMQGPQYKVEKDTTKWLLNILLLVTILALIGGVALLRQTIKGPTTVFDVIEGEALPPAY